MQLQKAISLILSQEPERMWQTVDVHAASQQYGSWSLPDVVNMLQTMARWDRPITVVPVGFCLWQWYAPVKAVDTDLEWV